MNTAGKDITFGLRTSCKTSFQGLSDSRQAGTTTFAKDLLGNDDEGYLNWDIPRTGTRYFGGNTAIFSSMKR